MSHLVHVFQGFPGEGVPSNVSIRICHFNYIASRHEHNFILSGMCLSKLLCTGMCVYALCRELRKRGMFTCSIRLEFLKYPLTSSAVLHSKWVRETYPELLGLMESVCICNRYVSVMFEHPHNGLIHRSHNLPYKYIVYIYIWVGCKATQKRVRTDFTLFKATIDMSRMRRGTVVRWD